MGGSSQIFKRKRKRSNTKEKRMKRRVKPTQTKSNALTETIRRRRSPMTSYSVKCAYCDHERKYMIMESKLPFEGIEHMYCPSCGRDFKHDRGTGIAYTLENIMNKQEEHG